LGPRGSNSSLSATFLLGKDLSLGRVYRGVGADDIDANVLYPAGIDRVAVDFPESIGGLLPGAIEGDGGSSPHEVFLAIGVHREHRMRYASDFRREWDEAVW